MTPHTETLRSLVERCEGLCIAVLGDPMLDYYHFGHVDRISPEAPVPVYVEDKLDLRDGGAHNVSANLAGLGCKVIHIFPPPPWTMKHRYLVGAQQVFRIDRDKDHSHQRIEWPVKEGDWRGLVISDYAKGWCNPARCREWIGKAQERKAPVVVDPKGTDWGKYGGADFICPNDAEYRTMLPTPHFLEQNLLHKQGAAGMTLYRRHQDPVHLEHQARRVFDVTGAGDTVVAVFAACLALGASCIDAAVLANIAAGIVVGEVGTTPITRAVLLAELT